MIGQGVVERGGTIVWRELELDLMSPSLVVDGMFPVFKLGSNH